jgi:hypothetical protein
MKRLLLFLCFGCAPLFAATAPPRTLTLAGPATNTTVAVTAVMHLTLVLDGEKAAAELKTDAPLTGSGPLKGRFIGGWCELEGRLAEGFTIKIRGVLNARDFRGTYLAAVPGTPLQYGKFNLAVQPAPSSPLKP